MSDQESKRVAEQLNGRLAMLGIVACIGAYLTTGQIILASYRCQSYLRHTKYHPLWQSYGVSTP